MAVSSNELQVKQVNCFYNYTIGLDVIEVDLVQTGIKLLDSDLVSSVFFSDLKALYRDEHGGIQLECIRTEGRHWDSEWAVELGETPIWQDSCHS